MRFADIVVPDTSAARGALEVATAYCSPALLNHSVRAYLWAAAYAGTNGIAFDAELLYVSSIGDAGRGPLASAMGVSPALEGAPSA
ncbi:hypothetical protein AB0B56_29710 [Streptosporangium canum]|uniref:hypothetical protein n=1 Tax=Streptosporangium canum TaxID=324952 RepID=UPI003439E749